MLISPYESHDPGIESGHGGKDEPTGTNNIWIPQYICWSVKLVAVKFFKLLKSLVLCVMETLQPCGSQSLDTGTTRRRYDELLPRHRRHSSICCRGELKTANFWLSYQDPDALVSSQWLSPSAMYAAYRILIALYFFIWFVVSWIHYGPTEGASLLRFLSEWSYDLLTLSYILRAGLACHGYNRQTTKEMRALPRMTRVLKLSWVLFNISSCSAVVVSLAYWTVVFDASEMTSRLDWALSIQRHSVQSLFVIIDLMITAIPIRLFHLYQPIAYICVYTLFSAIYNIAGNPPIYEYLNWDNEPKQAASYFVVMGFAGTTASWMFLYGIYNLRSCLYNKLDYGLDEPHRFQLIVPGGPPKHTDYQAEYTMTYPTRGSDFGIARNHNPGWYPISAKGTASGPSHIPFPSSSRMMGSAFQQGMNQNIKHANQIMQQSNIISPTRVRFMPDQLQEQGLPPVPLQSRSLSRIYISSDNDQSLNTSFGRLFPSSENEGIGHVTNIYIPE